jgi:thiol-disulfide isomerase/thioredoxin
MNIATRLLIAAAIVASIGAPVVGLLRDATMSQPAHSQTSGRLAAFDRANTWLNSKPLTPQDLRGKVVLVDFWTYTCINWLRTLPYIRAWSEKYKDQGLVVIGVHSPEFAFEKNLDNIRRAVSDMRIDYPVAVDSEHLIWRAFNNQAWPALYFIDAEGRLRHHYFGEGAYEESERLIQQLLTEAGASNVSRDLVSVEGRGLEAAPDWGNLKTPETYLRYELWGSFASPGGAALDQSHAYAFPDRLRMNNWALSGDWTMSRAASALNKPNGRIAYRFHARDVHLVMGPATPGKSVRFRVLIDGQPPGTDHGGDINAQGYGTVTGQRLYQLVRQSRPIAERFFEIEFLDPGVEAYCFTFG